MKHDLQRAFSLVEVVLAIGIAAFALVAVLGLLPVGLNTLRENIDETIATNILTTFEADLRNIPEGESDSPLYGVPVRSVAATTQWEQRVDRNGRPVDDRQEADYLVTCTIHPPGTTGGGLRYIHLRVGWPGRAVAPTGAVETVVAMTQRRL